METTKTTHSEVVEACIDRCNKLLRGERSAVETYDLAIEKFGDDPRLRELRAIQDEHRSSIADLEHNILSMGGTPDQDAGAWGVFAKGVQAAANLFGEESAVESLQKGEEIGLNDYEDALESGDLTPECVSIYQEKLIPRVRAHIFRLERIEEQVDD